VPEPAPGEAASLPVPDLRDPVVFTERQLLQALIQYPGQFTDATVDSLRPEEFVAPAHRAVLDGIRIAAPTARRASTAAWVAAVGEAAPLAVRSLVSELSVAPLPTRFDSSSGLPPQRYLDSLVVGVRDAQLGRLIADAMASVRRVQNDPESDPTDLRERTMALHRLELERVALRESLSS
jgi:DNA primase